MNFITKYEDEILRQAIVIQQKRAKMERVKDPNANGSYSIMINEEQRVLILGALGDKITDDLDPDSEIRTLVELFDELPGEEVEAPGALHGFCL